MSLFRSAATVGGFTLASRVLGFVRDMLLAGVLGTGPVTDAFVVAFRFPNLFRRLFGEGAFNSAFVPLFARHLEADGETGGRRFAEEVLSVLLVTLLVFTAIAEILMPWLMYLIAPGFAGDPDKFDLAVTLTRFAFPYLGFMSLVALFSGVLNSLGRFAVAAAAPIALNIVLILALLVAAMAGFGNSPRSGVLLATGVSVAGFIQLAMVIAACRRAGMWLGWRRPRITPGVRRLVRLGIPGVIAGGITQVNVVIGTIIASLAPGAVSWLYFAERIYQLPLGVIGIAIGVVLLPELSRRLRAGDTDGAANSENRALEFSMLLTVPAAVALVVMPFPIVQVLFERGNFVAADTVQTSLALAAFGLGLPAFVLVKVYSPAYFAREDTRTPMLHAGASVGANVVLSLVLFHLIGVAGIALATSLAGWLNAGLLWWTLVRRGHHALDERARRRLPRTIMASLLMGAVLWVLVVLLQGWFIAEVGLVVRGVLLALLVATGAAIFFAAAHALGAAHVNEVRRAMRRR